MTNSATPHATAGGPTSVEDAAHDVTPPPEMNEALSLVQRIGGRELLLKVISLFRTTSEQRLSALRAALQAGDPYQVSRLSHAMKGSAAQVGAESLRAASFFLEKQAQTLTPAQISEQIDTLAREAVVAWAHLEAYARSSGGQS